MQIINKNINDLKKAEYNPRKDLKPGDKEYEKIKKSIIEFGYVEPIIINSVTGNIVGGHQRLKVLQDLGYTEIECVVINIDLDKEKTLNIALNKITGEWDFPLLKELLQELNDSFFDISLTGFDAEELDTMFANIEPIEIGDNETKDKNKKTYHCPKCGFDFIV